MSDKTLYTLIVHSENIAGLLNQITAVFTRRQINIESLNVSASSIKGGYEPLESIRPLQRQRALPSLA